MFSFPEDMPATAFVSNEKSETEATEEAPAEEPVGCNVTWRAQQFTLLGA